MVAVVDKTDRNCFVCGAKVADGAVHECKLATVDTVEFTPTPEVAKPVNATPTVKLANRCYTWLAGEGKQYHVPIERIKAAFQTPEGDVMMLENGQRVTVRSGWIMYSETACE